MKVAYSSQASKKEVESLPVDMRARFQRIVELMETAGTHMIGMPYMRQIDGEIYEMRLRGVAGIARAMYVAVEKDELVILHSFVKKTQKTHQQAIELAKKRWRNYR